MSRNAPNREEVNTKALIAKAFHQQIDQNPINIVAIETDRYGARAGSSEEAIELEARHCLGHQVHGIEAPVLKTQKEENDLRN